jgi:hypothetical protein
MASDLRARRACTAGALDAPPRDAGECMHVHAPVGRAQPRACTQSPHPHAGKTAAAPRNDARDRLARGVLATTGYHALLGPIAYVRPLAQVNWLIASADNSQTSVLGDLVRVVIEPPDSHSAGIRAGGGPTGRAQGPVGVWVSDG